LHGREAATGAPKASDVDVRLLDAIGVPAELLAGCEVWGERGGDVDGVGSGMGRRLPGARR
jgi:hypothetical protein